MKNLFLFILSILIFTSCNLSYSKKTEVKTVNKTIDGVDYSLENIAEYKNSEVLFAKKFELNNIIIFHGMEKAIGRIIYKSDFEDKIDFNKIKKFHIDSVSFSVNSNKDKVDLVYYLDLGNNHETVTMELGKDNGTWNLNQ